MNRHAQHEGPSLSPFTDMSSTEERDRFQFHSKNPPLWKKLCANRSSTPPLLKKPILPQIPEERVGVEIFGWDEREKGGGAWVW